MGLSICYYFMAFSWRLSVSEGAAENSRRALNWLINLEGQKHGDHSQPRTGNALLTSLGLWVRPQGLCLRRMGKPEID